MNVRVTATGQITIPKEICERLGFEPGTEMEVQASGDELRLVPVLPELSQEERRRQITAWLERVAGTVDLGGMTTDEYMEMLRGPREDLDPR